MSCSTFKRILILLLLFAILITAACGGQGEVFISGPVLLRDTLASVDFGIVFRPGDTALRDKVWTTLQLLSEDGTVGRIAGRWFGADMTNIPPNMYGMQLLSDVQTRRLIVGFDPEMAPMSYQNNDGDFVGFDIDLAYALCAHLGWELELVPIDPALWALELQSGSVDVLWGGIAMTADVLAHATSYVLPYMESRQVLVAMYDSGINTLRHLRGRTVALRLDSAAKQALEQNPDFRNRLSGIILHETIHQSLDMLEEGLIDAVIMDEVKANYILGARR